jgi:hypothetical protein
MDTSNYPQAIGTLDMLVNDDVANVLERETEFTIENWYSRVEKENDLITVPLSREQRCAHLPEMFRDLVTRLRDPLPLGTRALASDAAYEHGCLRRDQGYTAAMMVEESRMLQVSIFQTLQLHLKEEKPAELLLGDVMAIADEVDSQLAQAMTSYLSKANRDSKVIKP